MPSNVHLLQNSKSIRRIVRKASRKLVANAWLAASHPCPISTPPQPSTTRKIFRIALNKSSPKAIKSPYRRSSIETDASSKRKPPIYKLAHQNSYNTKRPPLLQITYRLTNSLAPKNIRLPSRSWLETNTLDLIVNACLRSCSSRKRH